MAYLSSAFDTTYNMKTYHQNKLELILDQILLKLMNKVPIFKPKSNYTFSR